MSSHASSGLRLGFGLPLAALITVFIFLAMSGMIREEKGFTKNAMERDPISVVRQRTDTDLVPVETTRPDIPDTVPPAPRVREWRGDDPRTVETRAATRPETLAGEDFSSGPITMDGVILPIQPTYPQRCASRGLEGSVTVQFDVTASGNVINERVLRSTEPCFDQAALDAISRWKFRANGAGNTIATRGLTKTFSFRLRG